MRGCFADTTKLRMADGTDKPIKDAKPGDFVFNPISGKAHQITRMTVGPERDRGMIEVGYDGNVVVVTSAHPFAVKSGGLKQASDLTKADSILGRDGKFHPLTALRQRAPDANQRVVNVELRTSSRDDPGEHMVLADGIVAGDLFLQERLQEEGARRNRIPLARVK